MAERTATASEPIVLQEYKGHTTNRLTSVQRQTLESKFGKYIKVEPTWNGDNECRLVARQYVGTIIVDDVQIIIKPKVPLDNLFYMLTYAYDLPEFKEESALLSESEDLFEFIVTIFLKQVERLVRSGLHRSYIEEEDNQNYLRGRLLLAPHLQENLVKAGRFYQRTNEHTSDVLENQILLFTLRLLSRLDFKEKILTIRTRRLISAFQLVNWKPITARHCDEIVYTRLNSRYRDSIHLAKLLIQHLSVEGRAGGVPFSAYLLDMNLVFELYVGRYLLNRFAEHPTIDVQIQDDLWLDVERIEKGIPDIVLYQHNQPALVLDTKYKDFDKKPKQGDRNQMLVYCQSLNLRRGLLVYPNPPEINYRNIFHPTTSKIELQAVALSLDGSLEAFQSRCEQFARSLEQIVTL